MQAKEELKLPASLLPFVETACVRLHGLHPGARVTWSGRQVWVEAVDVDAAAAAARTLRHLVYQERIYADARDTRQAIYAKLLSA